jgi:8-oxo-dGTP diphosphatase
MPAPQFGAPQPDRRHRDRPAVFGIALQDGKIALVQVEKPGHPAWLDLPGGALDAGEDEAQALTREFGEETGLAIAPGAPFARADQYFVNTDGEAFNNRAGFWTVARFAEASQLKIEDDHTLVWLDPYEALSRLRHDAHAWAVAAWLRRVAPRARGG